VWSIGVVEILESLDEGFELGDGRGQVISLVELASPGFLHAFDGAVEFGALGWQHIEGNAVLLASSFESGHEFTPSVDLDSLDGERSLFEDLGQEARRRGAGGAVGDVGDGPARHRAGSREVFEPAARLSSYVEGINLDALARLGGCGAVLGESLGIVTPHPASSAVLLTPRAHAQDQATIHQMLQDAADGRLGGPEALGLEQWGQRLLAPGGELPSQGFDAGDQRLRPGRSANRMRSPRAGFQAARSRVCQALSPAVDRGSAGAEDLSGFLATDPVASETLKALDDPQALGSFGTELNDVLAVKLVERTVECEDSQGASLSQSETLVWFLVEPKGRPPFACLSRAVEAALPPHSLENPPGFPQLHTAPTTTTSVSHVSDLGQHPDSVNEGDRLVSNVATKTGQ